MAKLSSTRIYGNLTVDNQITSSIATGTPPFVISSTTVVPNLNVDMLEGYHGSTSATANTVVIRDTGGYIYATYFNSNRANETSAAASYIYDSGDGWMRKKTLANAKTELVTLAAVTTALGYTPYSNANPSGYVTSSGVTSIATSGAITGGTITTTGTITHSTAAGYVHIPAGGASSQILQYASAGTAQWYTPPWTTNTGTVTSVALSVPTGLSISGSPITTTGTLAISLATGYTIPSTTAMANAATAYGWGNHASAGYATASHASTAITYGLGTTTNYGHVKTINALTQSSHSDGTALSAYQGYILNNAISGKAPKSHLADDDTYGVGDSDYYGHCRVLNILTRSTYYDGEALSAYQGYALKTLVDGKAASSHTHGNISNAGAIGSTSGLMVKTTGSGVLTTLAAGTTLQYLRGDGTWASPSGWRSIKNWGTYLSSNNATPVAITTTESISSDKRIGIVISASTSSLRPQQIFWINTKNATSAYANGFVLNVVGNDTYSGGIILYQIEFYCKSGVLYMDDVYKVTITTGSPAACTCVSTTDIKVWDVLVSDY